MQSVRTLAKNITGALADAKRVFVSYSAADGINVLNALQEHKAALQEQIEELRQNWPSLFISEPAESIEQEPAFDSLHSLDTLNRLGCREYKISSLLPRCACCRDVAYQVGYAADSEALGSSVLLCTNCSEFAWLFNQVDATYFASFAQVFIASQMLVDAEEVLSLLFTACKILIAGLRRVIPRSLAVSQRGFFTHLAAHPPDNTALFASGLFLGRVQSLSAM